MKLPYKISFVKFLYSVIFFLILLSFNQDNERNYFSLFAINKSLPIDADQLKSCDIIFRRGLSFVSNIVLSADKNSPYSHVGLIIKENNYPYVIHAVPDESESNIDKIKKESIEQFLRFDRATAYAIYRMNHNFDKAKIELFLDSVYNKNTLFDDDFDLLSSEKMYCTELIYKAFLNSNIDLVENKFDTLFIPIGKNPFLLPGRIITSSKLHKVTDYIQN